MFVPTLSSAVPEALRASGMPGWAVPDYSLARWLALRNNRQEPMPERARFSRALSVQNYLCQLWSWCPLPYVPSSLNPWSPFLNLSKTWSNINNIADTPKIINQAMFFKTSKNSDNKTLQRIAPQPLILALDKKIKNNSPCNRKYHEENYYQWK